MTYKEYRENRQKEFDALPIFFAFSNEQFKRAMNERGLKENDTDKIYSLPGGSGGFYLRADSDKIKEFFNKEDNVLELLEKDEEFAVDAFDYEMANHEYAINYQGDWDVLECFFSCDYGDDKDYRDYIREAGFGDSMIKCYEKARNQYLKRARENDWF